MALLEQHALDTTTPIYTLSAYMAGTADRQLTPEIATRTRHHLLDTIAAIVSGTELIAGSGGIKFIRTQGGVAQAHVAGTDIVTSAINAAWANAMCAHADETDDHHNGSITHPGCCVVPASLAVGELTGASGLEFLRAVAHGYDMAARIGMALTNRVFYEGASMPSFGGGFGAGAAASALLRLDAQQTRYMLSLVAQQTAGARSWQRDQDHMEKAFVFGVPARNGVTAALLVQSGFTGVDDVFSGKFNFFERYTTQPEVIHLTRDLGTVNEIMNASMKKFCVGGPIQAPLEGLLTLMSQGVQASDIIKVDAHVPARRALVVDNSHNPSICLQHVLALLLVDGKVDFVSIHDIDRLEDPAVRRERAKVNLVYDTEMDKVDPRRPVDVTVTLKDGTSRNYKAEAVRGTTYLPWRQDEVEAKAMDLIGPVLGTAQARKICDLVANIETAPNVRVLAEALSVRA